MPALSFFHSEDGPSKCEFPAGATRHLVVLSATAGQVSREAEGKLVRHQVRPGFVTVVPRGKPIRWWWDEPVSYSVLALDDTIVSSLAGRHFANQPGVPVLRFSERNEDPAIASIAAVMAANAAGADSGDRTADGAYADSLARVLAIHLLRHYAKPDAASDPAPPRDRSRAVEKAIGFIEQHYGSSITLDDMAAAACLSPYHFLRLFRRKTGLTPHQYLVRTRLEAARELIGGQRQVSLSDIATLGGSSAPRPDGSRCCEETPDSGGPAAASARTPGSSPHKSRPPPGRGRRCTRRSSVTHQSTNLIP